MDNETAKILILEKLFDELVPKIASYNILFQEGVDCYTWFPNFHYLNERIRESGAEEIRIQVSINAFGKFESAHLIKTNHHEAPQHRRMRMLARAAVGGVVEEIPAPDVVEKKFFKKEEAIKTISKDINLSFLIKIGMCAKREIDAYEDRENALIGSLKEVLGFNPDVDILNLETRRILTEIIK